jgi:hypothetical protein
MRAREGIPSSHPRTASLSHGTHHALLSKETFEEFETLIAPPSKRALRFHRISERLLLLRI